MANKDRDSKCLDLALKHIEALEAQIDVLEKEAVKSAAVHYKKNKIIETFMDSDTFLHRMRNIPRRYKLEYLY